MIRAFAPMKIANAGSSEGAEVLHFGHGLFGPTLVELNTDTEKPVIDPMDVAMERMDRVVSEAARAFSGFAREAALPMAHLPAVAF